MTTVAPALTKARAAALAAPPAPRTTTFFPEGRKPAASTAPGKARNVRIEADKPLRPQDDRIDRPHSLGVAIDPVEIGA